MADNRSSILNNPFEEPVLHYDADPNENLDYTKILGGRRTYSAHIGVAPNRSDNIASAKTNRRPKPLSNLNLMTKCATRSTTSVAVPSSANPVVRSVCA